MELTKKQKSQCIAVAFAIVCLAEYQGSDYLKWLNHNAFMDKPEYRRIMSNMLGAEALSPILVGEVRKHIRSGISQSI